MNTVLIVNHSPKACGVQQFGQRVYDLVADSRKVRYIYREIDSYPQYLKIINQIQPTHILYNWHRATMKWLIPQNMVNIVSYFIFHEEYLFPMYERYLFFGDYDLSNAVPSRKRILLPRPLLEYSGHYPDNEIYTIGSFGFGFEQKGFHTLTRLVCETFDNAIINLHIPASHYSDPNYSHALKVIDQCEKLIRPGIELRISQDFLDEYDLLEFLADNDVNVFCYTENGEGISSVIDYALSVKIPIAITDCQMFRHIKKPEIIISPNNTIRDIIIRGIEPLQEFYDKWSPKRFCQAMDEVFA